MIWRNSQQPKTALKSLLSYFNRKNTPKAGVVDRDRMLRLMDEIFVYYATQNHPQGVQIDLVLDQKQFDHLKDGNIRWLKNRMRVSRFFDKIKQIDPSLEYYKLNEDGFGIMETYESYSNYINAKTVESYLPQSQVYTNRVQRTVIIFTAAISFLTFVALYQQLQVQKQLAKLQETSLQKQQQPPQYTIDSHDVYYLDSVSSGEVNSTLIKKDSSKRLLNPTAPPNH